MAQAKRSAALHTHNMCTVRKQATLYFRMIMDIYTNYQMTRMALLERCMPSPPPPPRKKMMQLMAEMSDECEPSDNKFDYPGQPSHAELLLTEPAYSKSAAERK